MAAVIAIFMAIGVIVLTLVVLAIDIYMGDV